MISKVSRRYVRGFTLIELLVVIAIIGILSSVVLASLNSARQKGRDARRISDVKQMQLALELFYDANQSYPTTTDLTLLVTNGYIAALPTDPVSFGVYTYEMLDDASASCAADTCASYVLRATLEGAQHSALNGDVDGTVGATDCEDATNYYCQRP
jgi:prepilin-type N-terminal cleavage/methylation domain-containing protein